VIGLGSVGLPLVLLLCEQKFPVTGFEVDTKKLELVKNRGWHTYRITPAQIQSARANGFIRTPDYTSIAEMDVAIICVPTALSEHHEPDLTYTSIAAESIAAQLRAGQLVIVDSTTHSRATEGVLVPILESENKRGLKAARAGVEGDKLFLVGFFAEARRLGQHHHRAA